MPTDHLKVTIEARPLRLLYSKYAPNAALNAGSVRPLGAVRRCESSEKDERCISLALLERDVSKVERVERYLAMAGEGHGYVDMYGGRKSVPSVSNGSEGSRGGGNNRLRTQAFENKFKLAMSRAPDQNITKIYSKRVIQLPMLKINLETYIGETEDGRTIENTRKSLRNILDGNRKVGSSVKQAAITQYQFKTPAEIQREAIRLFNSNPSYVTDRLSALQQSHRILEFRDTPSHQDGSLKLESIGNDTVRETPTFREGFIQEESEGQDSDDDLYEPDVDDSSIVAHRLSSAATLGTSYKHIDFDSYSDADDTEHQNTLFNRQPTTSEMGEGNTDFPVWPSLDDMRNLRQDCGQSSLVIQPKRQPRDRDNHKDRIVAANENQGSVVTRNGVIPKRKITNHHVYKMKPKRKLDPIADYPHSAKECPMCNMFKVKEPTLCPPNTPRLPSDLPPEVPNTINEDSLVDGHVEGEGADDDEPAETDRSNVEFRRRHKLMNYDIHTVTPRLGPIQKGGVVGEVTANYRFGFVQAKAAR